MKNYIALFEMGKKGSYSVLFPDVPGVITAGRDFDETVRMAHEALAFHIDGLREDGLAVPEPSTLEQIKKNWDDWKDWEKDGNFLAVPIALLPSVDRTIRVDAMLPERLVFRIDSVARNRSAFLSRAAEYMLDNYTIAKRGGRERSIVRK
ncbi:MAG: type II toxin-antitoxin system HicB family antitoxin [Rickettsiales bacterium]|jgi:predicted RNase H-like HicB family nuclease|nr:type II toxin-antitoxin system HicB family antitoxin [Rickettsiales bacterium]